MKKFVVLVSLLCAIAVSLVDPAYGGRQGTQGRLVLGSYSAALYECRGTVDAAEVVDAEDSAAWFMWYDCKSPIIADHCNQGFDVLLDCEPGDVCCIAQGGELRWYVCVEVDHEAVNERTDMYLASGYNFMKNNDPGYVFMYTCSEVGDPYHITVAIWAPADNFFKQGPGGVLGFFPPSRPLSGSTPPP
jgi:hypothetical protein